MGLSTRNMGLLLTFKPHNLNPPVFLWIFRVLKALWTLYVLHFSSTLEISCFGTVKRQLLKSCFSRICVPQKCWFVVSFSASFIWPVLYTSFFPQKILFTPHKIHVLGMKFWKTLILACLPCRLRTLTLRDWNGPVDSAFSQCRLSVLTPHFHPAGLHFHAVDSHRFLTSSSTS